MGTADTVLAQELFKCLSSICPPKDTLVKISFVQLSRTEQIIIQIRRSKTQAIKTIYAALLKTALHPSISTLPPQNNA